MKGETKNKILGLVLFVVLSMGIFFLSFTSDRKELDKQIKSINITGNKLLDEHDYLAFAKLDNNEGYKELTLPVIKSRLEKHPYVKMANVEFSGNNEVLINIIEKEIKAVLVSNNEIYLASDNFEILPFIPGTKITNLPVISNINNDEFLKKNEILKTPGLVEAYKIIDAVSLADEGLSKKLSEINLRNGGDIILLFSGIKFPVILGRDDTVEKIFTFDRFVSEKNIQNELAMNCAYIDLRFENAIYLGNNDNAGLTE